MDPLRRLLHIRIQVIEKKERSTKQFRIEFQIYPKTPKPLTQSVKKRKFKKRSLKQNLISTALILLPQPAFL